VPAAFDRVDIDHRPWPMPASPWFWRQSWHDLLFAHWPVPGSAVRHLVPDWLAVDEFDGSTWVGLVPFRMTNVTLRGVPPVPFFSRFPEMNLRLYVERDGRPGIWFVSLDASRQAAVIAARNFAHLPYFHSTMTCEARGDDIAYSSVRRGDERVAFAATYGPTGPILASAPGSLDHFLTERYCLYTQDSRGRRLRMDIHHDRWPLQPAHADITTNRVADLQGIALPDTAPVLHFSRRIDVVGWRFESVGTR